MKILDDRLPPELADKIFRDIHKALQREINIIINHKIVFILVEKKMSFLVCETQNYYTALEVF